MTHRGVELRVLGCGEVVERGLAGFLWENQPQPKYSANSGKKNLEFYILQRSIV